MADDGSERIDQQTNRLLRVALVGVLVVGAFWLLVVGKSFLIPLVLAVFVWYLIEGLNGFWRGVRIAGRPIPGLVPASLSALVIFFLAYAFLSLIATNVTQMADAAPEYQEKLTALYEDAVERFDIDETALTDTVMERIDLGKITRAIGGVLGTLFGNGILIAMYVVFLLLERQYFRPKLIALVPTKEKRDTVRRAIGRIDQQVKIYLMVKIFVSLLTATGAYFIMRLMQLDFAEFWAVLIFVLNFIPYIGSTIASVLPSVEALAQFGSLGQAALLFAGIQAVQMSIGYVVEPTMMGKSLNISPLAVMLALTFWGMLWGIAGMFISVPITVVIMIVCAQFEGSRWVAVLLSKDGTFKTDDEPDV